MAKILLAPDYAKAFGIVLVVFGHTLRGLFTSGIVPQNEFWSAVDAIIYLFHMPLFFYISGLFVQQSMEQNGYTSFVKRSFMMLVPPLVIWSYLQFSLQYMAGSYANAQPDLAGLITAPFPPRQQFWFLGSLLIMMAVTGILLMRGALEKILWPLIGGLFVVQVLLWDSAVDYMVGKPWAHLLFSTLFFWPFFLLGIVFGTKNLGNIKMPTLLCLFLFVFSLVLYQYMEPLRAALSIVCVLCIYKMALNAQQGDKNGGRLSQAIAFVGMNSMMIYLAHIIFAAGFRVALSKAGIEDASLHLAGGVIAGIIGPLLLVPIGLYLGRRMPFIGRAVFPVRTHRV